MKLILLLFFFTCCFSSYCQTVLMKFYPYNIVTTPYGSTIANNGCGRGTICEFGSTFYTPSAWGPLPIKATQGCSLSVTDNSGLALNAIKASNYSSDNPNKVEADGIVMQYGFKKGINYRITVNAGYNNKLNNSNFPYLEMQVTNSYVTGTVCYASGNFPPVSLYTTTQPYAKFKYSSPNSFTFTANNCYSYLWLASGFDASAGEIDGDVRLTSLKIEELGGGYSISGINNFCTGSALYQLPAGLPAIWSIAPATGIATLSVNPGGNSATLTRIGNGSVTLTAAINNTCSGNITLTKQVSIGSPLINITSASNIICSGIYRTWSLNATSLSSVTNWLWTVDQPQTGSWYIYNNNMPNTTVDVTSGGGISVTATNSCGTAKSGITIWGGCSSSFIPITVSPNPSNGKVIVSIKQKDGLNKTTNSAGEVIRGVKVYNSVGTLIKSLNFERSIFRTMTMDLGDLRNGLYNLILTTNLGTYNQKVEVIK